MQIEIDVQQLSADIRALEERKEALLNAKGQVMSCMDKVNGMWEGAAHDSFVRQLTQDAQQLTEMMENIEHLLDSMKYAKAEYGKCADTVAEKIAAIRLSGDR